jgi:hypothetical protein
MFNPYAQSGWPNSQNPNAGSSRNTVPQPSLFGALPYSTPPAPLVPATLLSFSFSRFTPTILNCTVTGPQSRVYFRIITKFPSGGFTVIQNSENQPVVVIEWLKHPVIEIRDVVSKRPTALWLPLSQTKRYCGLPLEVGDMPTILCLLLAIARWRPEARHLSGSLAANIYLQVESTASAMPAL